MMYEEKLSNLKYDFEAFTVESFVRAVGKMLDRKIHLLAITMPINFSGAWVSDAELPNEYIFFDVSMPPMLATHTILHEVSHIILGHKTATITAAEVKKYINDLKSLPKDAALRTQQPGSDAKEEDAEKLASYIFQEAVNNCDTLYKSSLKNGNKYLGFVTAKK